MESTLFLVDAHGTSTLVRSAHIGLIFGRIKDNFPAILARFAYKPKIAYHLSRLVFNHLTKDYQEASDRKASLLREAFGIDYTGFKIVVDNKITMFFGPSDVQIDNVILKDQYNLAAGGFKGKVVIDAGANTGVFSVFAAKLGAKKVYAFEPILENVELIQKNALLNGVQSVIEPVPMALGDKEFETVLEYVGKGDPSASLVLHHPHQSTSIKKQKVKVTTIDSFMEKKGETASFIKMDVEGFEEQVLKGAKRTISAGKPILAFSAYHKPTDKQLLPEIVMQIRGDYRGKLLARAEEVFYFK
jgi:FkbM family methyltransferase